MSTPADLTRAVVERCRALGFARAGVARAEPTRYEAALRAWLADGRHGDMTYLADRADAMADPTRILDGARSIICVADRYHDGSADAAPAAGAAPRGRIARYARGGDYHRVIKKRLHALADELRDANPDAAFKTCVDTAPLLEREYAERAGLGAVGKHTLLIERGTGSYLLLGAVVTTLDLDPTPPADPDPCGSCTRCIDACPTDAITPWTVDARACISYLTIEHRGPIDERYHEGMGDWIFGCDVCQEVCPHNQPRAGTTAPTHDAYTARRRTFGLLEVLHWTEDDRRAVFARSAMKRAKLDMMKRNALIAAGNALRERDDRALRERVERIAGDQQEAALTRETARDVLRRLGEPRAGG